MIEKKNILGVNIASATRKEILEYIIKSLEKFRKKCFFVTPNPEFLVLASKNSAFKNILNKAELALADGVGVMIAGKVLGKPLKERFTGVELLESLCEKVAEKPITVGFLGGGHGIAEKTAKCLRKKYSKLKIGFVGEEWSSDVNARQPRVSDDTRLQNYENQSLDPASLSKSRFQSGTPPTFNSSESGLPRILQSKSAIHHSSFIIHHSVDILFVAFGAPKQEIWINENLENLPVKIAIGVGGAFDYISGKIPRAPGFIRSIGCEWLFRLVLQPWRIKRQLSLIEFTWLVFKEKLTNLFFRFN